jgi:hypothetical protein
MCASQAWCRSSSDDVHTLRLGPVDEMTLKTVKMSEYLVVQVLVTFSCKIAQVKIGLLGEAALCSC